ncbi:hypothetical protein ETC03_16135 [Geobacillus sp. MMMUD3]|nr:hypothetical protein [Geobacillus sp. MMMUD3]
MSIDLPGAAGQKPIVPLGERVKSYADAAKGFDWGNDAAKRRASFHHPEETGEKRVFCSNRLGLIDSTALTRFLEWN